MAGGDERLESAVSGAGLDGFCRCLDTVGEIMDGAADPEGGCTAFCEHDVAGSGAEAGENLANSGGGVFGGANLEFGGVADVGAESDIAWANPISAVLGRTSIPIGGEFGDVGVGADGDFAKRAGAGIVAGDDEGARNPGHRGG